MNEKNDLSRFQVPETIRTRQESGTGSPLPSCDPAAHLKRQVELLNSLTGNRTGYDCPRCRNRGYTFRLDGNEIVRVDCACMAIRKGLQLERNSGLSDLIKTKNFANFHTPKPWQRQAKDTVQAWAESPQDWLVCAGEPGSGKTHLSVAACALLLKQGRQVLYRRWRDVAQALKAASMDSSRQELLSTLREAEVLYLDDFLKTAAGRAPYPADLETALDILNPRYDRQAITILSTEFSPTALVKLDESLGSRILERTGKNGARFLYFSPATGEVTRNWRLTSHTDERSEKV